MTLVSHETVRDQHGAGHTIATERCDGPGCDKTIRSDNAHLAEWGSMIGFVDVDDTPGFDERPAGANWCSVPCLKAWAAAL